MMAGKPVMQILIDCKVKPEMTEAEQTLITEVLRQTCRDLALSLQRNNLAPASAPITWQAHP